MKKNNPEINQEVEKIFRDKMIELSSSVDCFDKISEKAFPEKNQDFAESGFTVCDLENITGKSKKPKFIKWTAVIVACMVCAFVLPQTRLVDNFIASLGGSSKKAYSKLIEEINAETSQNTYTVYDLPLDEYIKYDRLVTPLYACPFEDCGKDNINVRVFVRTYNDIPTNQIYAVEYTGEYTNSNFIAVADTKAKFTDEDLEHLDEIYTSPDETAVKNAVLTNFIPTITAESFMTDTNDNKVSVVSFDYGNIFKSDDETIYYSPAQIIYYGDKIDENPETYYYDINNLPTADGTWKNTICFDGFSSMPEESQSLFVRVPLFDVKEISSDNAVSISNTMSCEYIKNILLDENKTSGIDFWSLSLQSYGEKNISNFAVPYDNKVLKSMKMYFSKSGIMFSSDSNASVVLKSENTETTVTITPDSDYYNNLLSDEEIEEFFEMLSVQETETEFSSETEIDEKERLLMEEDKQISKEKQIKSESAKR
ncbi:MAG: hypothetical protein K2J39_05085 [Ruminococcus sp.]|nr:hypothetical protein [Ruminococcus sp.]